MSFYNNQPTFGQPNFANPNQGYAPPQMQVMNQYHTPTQQPLSVQELISHASSALVNIISFRARSAANDFTVLLNNKMVVNNYQNQTFNDAVKIIAAGIRFLMNTRGAPLQQAIQEATEIVYDGQVAGEAQANPYLLNNQPMQVRTVIQASIDKYNRFIHAASGVPLQSQTAAPPQTYNNFGGMPPQGQGGVYQGNPQMQGQFHGQYQGPGYGQPQGQFHGGGFVPNTQVDASTLNRPSTNKINTFQKSEFPGMEQIGQLHIPAMIDSNGNTTSLYDLVAQNEEEERAEQMAREMIARDGYNLTTFGGANASAVSSNDTWTPPLRGVPSIPPSKVDESELPEFFRGRTIINRPHTNVSYTRTAENSIDPDDGNPRMHVTREEVLGGGIVKAGQADSGYNDGLLDNWYDDTNDITPEDHYMQQESSGFKEEFDNPFSGTMRIFQDRLNQSKGTEMAKAVAQAEAIMGGGPTPADIPAHTVEDFSSKSEAEKRKIINNQPRHVGPAYVAKRQRLTYILAGDTLTVESKKVDYKVHETELLAPINNKLTGLPGNYENATSALDLAMRPKSCKEYLEIIDSKVKEDEEADLSTILVNQPMIEVDELVEITKTDEYQAPVMTTLSERLGVAAIELEGATVNVDAIKFSSYVVTDGNLETLGFINRAKTASSIVAHFNTLVSDTNLPTREVTRLHNAVTEVVNQYLKMEFHPEYNIDSFTQDLEELTDVLNEDFDDVEETLNTIYRIAVKEAIQLCTLKTTGKRLPSFTEATGIDDDKTGILASVENVTLVPFNYSDFPLAFSGDLGVISPTSMPKLFTVVSNIIDTKGKDITKFVMVTEDSVVFEFRKSLKDDDFIFINRRSN